jgi:hypothetical protein
MPFGTAHWSHRRKTKALRRPHIWREDCQIWGTPFKPGATHMLRSIEKSSEEGAVALEGNAQIFG